jgi:Tol biopolymer transport system component
MRADGTHQRRLTRGAGDDEEPEWSPDGKQILFASTRGGRKQIWVMSPNGTHQRPLIIDSVNVREPTWSPDGSMIAYDRIEKSRVVVYVAHASGAGRQPLAIACDDGASKDLDPDDPFRICVFAAPAPTWQGIHK